VREFIKKVSVALTIIGLLIMIGAAGSSDLATISLEEALNYAIVGNCLMVGSMLVYEYID
jgi:hypothetical protein